MINGLSSGLVKIFRKVIKVLIRLEVDKQYGKFIVREGIYQILPTRLTIDICSEVRILPCPVIEENYDKLSFFFTLKGWQEYGKYFCNLFWEKEGITEMKRIGPVFVRIVSDETEKGLTPIYTDEYQKAFEHDDILGVKEKEVEIHCSSDWEFMEEQFPELA